MLLEKFMRKKVLYYSRCVIFEKADTFLISVGKLNGCFSGTCSFSRRPAYGMENSVFVNRHFQFINSHSSAGKIIIKRVLLCCKNYCMKINFVLKRETSGCRAKASYCVHFESWGKAKKYIKKIIHPRYS